MERRGSCDGGRDTLSDDGRWEASEKKDEEESDDTRVQDGRDEVWLPGSTVVCVSLFVLHIWYGPIFEYSLKITSYQRHK